MISKRLNQTVDYFDLLEIAFALLPHWLVPVFVAPIVAFEWLSVALLIVAVVVDPLQW